MKQLAEQLGTADSGALALKQQITLQQFAEVRNETARLHIELQRTNGQLKMKTMELKRAKEQKEEEGAVPPLELAASDQVMGKLQEELDGRTARIRDTQSRAKGPFVASLVEEQEREEPRRGEAGRS